MVKTSTSERSPLSPTRWPPDAFVWWQSLLFAVLLAVAAFVPATIFLAFAIAFGAVSLPQARNATSLTWPQLGAQLMSYAAAFAVIAGVLPAIARRPLFALGLRPPGVRDVAWGLGGALAMIVVAIATGALQDAIFHLRADEVQVQWLRATRGTMIAGFVLLACVGAPVFEELIFRGFAFNALLRYTPAWLAVLLSSALFGIAHLLPGNAGAIAPLAAGGVVLALVYYRTGSLIASMITHATFNAVTVVAVVVFHQT